MKTHVWQSTLKARQRKVQRNLPASTRAAHLPDNSKPSATPQPREGRGTFQKNLGGALPGGAEAQNGGRGGGGGWSRGAKWRPRGGAHAPPYRTQPLRGLVCTRGSGCPAPQRRHGTEPEGARGWRAEKSLFIEKVASWKACLNTVISYCQWFCFLLEEYIQDGHKVWVYANSMQKTFHSELKF